MEVTQTHTHNVFSRDLTTYMNSNIWTLHHSEKKQEDSSKTKHLVSDKLKKGCFIYMTLAYGKVKLYRLLWIFYLWIFPVKILPFCSYPLIDPNLCILDRSALEFPAISSTTFFWGSQLTEAMAPENYCWLIWILNRKSRRSNSGQHMWIERK